jgi:hypothetical protein
MTPPGTKKIINERRRLKAARERSQFKFRHEDEDFHDSIAAKLASVSDPDEWLSFQRCGREEIWRQCASCKSGEWLEWRCNLKWCPRCQWKLSEMRKEFLTKYSNRLHQPKHLVLTSKNFPLMTRKKLRENQIAMMKLRDRNCFANVKGGCVSVECTWAEKGSLVNGVRVAGGFHLHSHWLIEARWIDLKEVEASWADLINQEMAVVRVYDAREKDYLQELCKYVVDGSELASWPAEIIRQFVTAAKGVRFFFPFGNAWGIRREINREIAVDKPEKPPCVCGCDRTSFKVLPDEKSQIGIDARRKKINQLKWTQLQESGIKPQPKIPSMRSLMID